jgi:glucose-1-phosphate thymidylyltransferase
MKLSCAESFEANDLYHQKRQRQKHDRKGVCKFMSDTLPYGRVSASSKAVILARGLGTRMRRQDENVALDNHQSEIADAGIKAMIRIERPFLDYVLNDLAEVGFTEICLVIGDEQKLMRDYYESLSTSRVRISFAVQEKPLGTADAVAAAENFAGDDRFLVINSDNCYPLRAFQLLHDLNEAGTIGFERESLVSESNFTKERVEKFAVMKIDEEGYLKRIIEKPDEIISGDDVVVSMNCWLFTPKIFEACRNIKPSSRNELELADAVQYAIDVSGERIKVLPMRAGVLDLSSRADIESVTKKLRGKDVRL